LEKTRKPFKVWFRAVFEISSRRNGISAKELADLRLWLLQDGVELAAQARGGAGASGARAAKPSRSNR
jgi:hypothetical protein